MKTVLVLGLLLGIVGCAGDGCILPTDRFIYQLACDALKNEPAVPPGATPAPIEETLIGIGKNAANIDLPYTCADAAGNAVRGSQTFWIKRVARTWKVDRAHPTAVYTNAPSAADMATQALPAAAAQLQATGAAARGAELIGPPPVPARSFPAARPTGRSESAPSAR
jgi:hypothetical protein